MVATTINKVFEVDAGTGQALALASPCDHTLFCGARGAAKTSAQLMYFRRFVGLGYGPFWRGVIFDRRLGDLDDVIHQSKKFFLKFNDGAKFVNRSGGHWIWPTGEVLFFRQANRDDDYDKSHGKEFPFIGFNEMGKYPTSYLYDMHMSCNRSSFDPESDTPSTGGEYDTHDGRPLPPIPLRYFSTTNPYGPGYTWMRDRFITCAPYGQIVRTVIPGIFDHDEGREVDITRSQVTIFGNFHENRHLSPHAKASIMHACEGDPQKRRAWIYGIWGRNPDGAFGDLWDDNVHVIDRFPIPPNWNVDRSFDWGSSTPFATCWWAESNGEEVKMADGKLRCFPKGTLIQIDEWYGSHKVGSNRGLKLTPADVARGIVHRDNQLVTEGWLKLPPRRGPADNSIGDVQRTDIETIQQVMADNGCKWEASDKSQGSRHNGLSLMRNRLLASTRGEGPGIYIMRNCKATIQTVPDLPLDPDLAYDDIDTDTEDHAWDAIRYRVLKASNRYAKTIKTKWAA